MTTGWLGGDLTVASDDGRMRRYRALQSRWRATVLGLEPGVDSAGRAIPSLLPADAPRDAQWLTRPIADYVADRLLDAKKDHEAIEEGRLFRNLLSSQPLCFNLFGQLAASRPAAARVLSQLLRLQVDSVRGILVEHAPRGAKAVLRDRSAFDALLACDGPSGALFFGVETKYTEPFSPREYDRPAYIEATDHPQGWFKPGSAAIAKASVTNQLWRTLMLAQATEQAAPDHGTGAVVVLSLQDDVNAQAAVAGVRRLLREPDQRLHHVSYESLMEVLSAEPALRSWAALFSARYLDA